MTKEKYDKKVQRNKTTQEERDAAKQEKRDHPEIETLKSADAKLRADMDKVKKGISILANSVLACQQVIDTSEKRLIDLEARLDINGIPKIGKIERVEKDMKHVPFDGPSETESGRIVTDKPIMKEFPKEVKVGTPLEAEEAEKADGVEDASV